LIAIVRRYLEHILADDVAGISAELAYRFMFATFPFAIFLVALSGFVASWLGVADPGNRIIDAIGKDLPANVVGPARNQLQVVLAHTQPGLLSAGALVTFCAAASGTSSLMKAMNRACDVPETRPIWRRLLLAVVLTVVGGVAIVISFVAVVGWMLATHRFVDQVGLRDVWPWLALVRWPVSFGLLVLAVAALMRFAPDYRMPWRWVVLAAAIFALVWLAVTDAFGLYVAQFTSYDSTYGALAGVIVLMLWFYLTAFVLVCAAELAALPVRIRATDSPAGEGGDPG